MAATHLIIIGERSALGWVVTEQRMAFPPGRSKQAQTLAAGDDILLYTTRGCFGNPTRDLGRIIGTGTISDRTRVLGKPVIFAERTFTEGCALRLDGLAPLRQGLVLRDLVPDLSAFPDKASWSIRLRRPILTLPARDADLLRSALRPMLRPYREVAEDYRWEPPRR